MVKHSGKWVVRSSSSRLATSSGDYLESLCMWVLETDVRI